MKKVLIALSVIIPFATVSLLAYYFYQLYSSLSVKYEVKKFSIKNLLKLEVDVDLSVEIDNKSKSSISAKKVSVNVYYKKDLVATVDLDAVRINSSGKTNIEVPLVLKLSQDSGEIITLYTSGQPIPLKIKIKARLYGIPVSFSTDYIYIKS